MPVNFINRKPQLRGTAAALAAENITPLAGEWVFEIDQTPIKAKIGDGTTAYNDLPYWSSGGITTLEEAIDADPIATSVPTFEGGASFGDDSGAPFLVQFKDSAGSWIFTTAAGETQIKFSEQISFSTKKLLLGVDAVISWSDTDLNVSTNNLSLADGDVRPIGFRVKVSVGGTRDFGSGNITLAAGDILAKDNGGIYFKAVDNNQSGGSDYVSNDVTGEPTGSDAVLKMVSLTQAEYDAGTPNATTFYVITDA